MRPGLDARADVRIDRLAHVVHEVADEAIALGADDPAGGRRVVAEAVRQRRPHDAGAENGERLDRRVVGREHIGRDADPLSVRHHSQPQAGDATAQRRQRIGGRPGRASAGSRGSGPFSTRKISAASSTERASGPGVSSVE